VTRCTVHQLLTVESMARSESKQLHDGGRLLEPPGVPFYGARSDTDLEKPPRSLTRTGCGAPLRAYPELDNFLVLGRRSATLAAPFRVQ
jgi:hypothetical protein